MATIARDPLMPADLDEDGRVSWWALGTIAGWNLDGRWTTLTAAAVVGAGDPAWEALVDETDQIDKLTGAQRAQIVATLAELEAEDVGQPERWWER